MNVFITGHNGFIAINLVSAFKRLGHKVINFNEARNRLITNSKGEPCVYQNSEDAWHQFFLDTKTDVIVHNAALVGTDVVALNPEESTLSNVMGTHTICRVARKASIPVCYLGSSVIYDTPKYQNAAITERSEQRPGTFYGAQKLAGEHIVMSTASEWLIMRPLFAYGGLGDMNSLPAKTFYAQHRGVASIPMFLDPEKSKDYMHVEDFCDAVALGCDAGLWHQDFNISAEQPLKTGEIVNLMSSVCGHDLEKIIKWHPETDYLGNHILSSEKFRNATAWTPKFTLAKGLRQSWESILGASSQYNPLSYLDEAQKRGVDLVQYFPKGT